jgi:hypothetical protein
MAVSLVCGAVIGWAGVASAQTPRAPRVNVTVGSSPEGRALPRGFVGTSLEYDAVRRYTGHGAAVNPVLVALLRALAPGAQRPVIRIGGNSTDYSWLPVRGMSRPGGIRYRLGGGWLDSTLALARALDAQLIMGVNLEAGSPRLAAAEAHAFLHSIGRRYVEALEIGNEPDLYAIHPWYVNRQGTPVYARRPTYGFPQFMTQFTRWSHALPAVPLAGPALASTAWFRDLPRFEDSSPRLRTVTVHRYPLSNCIHDPHTPGYPTIGRLLTGRSSAALAREVAPAVQAAHSHGLSLRLDELNSVSCSGRLGVSNTFASALWALNALFGLAQAGVDGVNIHTWPGAAYQLFSFRRTGGSGGRWLASVAPEYYGLLAFGRAFPPAARLLPVSVNGDASVVRAWATLGHGGDRRVVLINDSQSSAFSVRLRLAGASSRPGHEEWLRAPHARSVGGVTLGGQSFGAWTSSGHLAGRTSQPHVVAEHGVYTLRLPPASAVLLRF